VTSGNFITFLVDFFSKSVTLFEVMGIMKSLYADLSCEEVFELERHCDERREADIAAQDAAMEAEAAAQAEREREDHERDLAMAEDERCWCKFFESCPSCFGLAKLGG